MTKGLRQTKTRSAGAARPPASRTLTPEAKRRLAWLTQVLGPDSVERLLGMETQRRSDTSAGLKAADERALLDLAYVVARLANIWVPEIIVIWLESPNAHLGGAVPSEALRRRRVAEVINAVDAQEQGAYA